MLIKASDLDVPEARRKLVERICGDVAAAKKHFNGDFAQMLEDMDIVREGRPKRWPKSNYIVNITQRYIRQKTAHLYAKNPRAVSKRRHRLDFQVWDGKPESLIGALAQARDLAAQGAEIPAEIQELLMDINQGSASRQKLERIGKTMEVLWNYYTTEQVPSFKSQMKATVRAAVSCGVGYVKLGFQRDTDSQPDEEASSKIADMRGRLAHVERLMAEMQSGDIDETEAEAEELRLAIDELTKESEVVMREGLVFDFPFSTSIIPDPGCVSIKGWVGADWLAQELFLAPDEVKAF